MPLDDGYDRLAKYYDAGYSSLKTLGPDAAFYQALARQTGGPVLELGCGTGRVLLPIAQAGTACVGLDPSQAMLDRFREKLGHSRVELVQGKMQDFDLGAARFELIFSAFRAFQHLGTVPEQLSCLASVRRHLAPSGVFALDVFNPRLERMAASSEAEASDLEFDFEGRKVRRFARNLRDRARQVTLLKTRYVEYQDDAVVAELEVDLSMRWYYRFELEHLLYRAGFSKVEIFGDFDMSPVGADSPALVVVAS